MRLEPGMGIAARIAAAAALALLALPAAADDGERIRDLERRLEKSMQLVEQLGARVLELERRQRAGAPAPAAAPRAAATPRQDERIEALERSVTQLSTGGGARGFDFGVPLHGFADVGYEHSKRAAHDGRKSGFVVGNLDFYLTPGFGDRVKSLVELVFEVESDGGLLTDLERIQLGYTFSDALTAWVGRFHTPYGYWNTGFHHGVQLQTAASRPRFIEFEDKGGIMATHSVGLWLTGQAGFGRGRAFYDAYVANGSRVAGGIVEFNGFRDDNASKAYGARVGYRFGGALDGLTLGLHAMHDRIEAEGPAGRHSVDLAMGGGFVVLERGDWEAIGEYYGLRNRDREAGGARRSSWAAFLQLGRTFAESWTPYLRWEKAQLDADDLYFASLEFGRTYRRGVLGLRYDLNSRAALKLEAARMREGGEGSRSEARAQFAVRF